MTLRIAVGSWGLALLGSLGLLGCEDEVITAACTPTGEDSGLEECQEGYTHRVAVATCESIVPREGVTCDDGGTGNCSSDSDCTERPHGVCSQGQICGCVYGCASDADCDAGFACVCGEITGRCVQANCGIDGDCDEGMLCAVSLTGSAGCASSLLACTHPDDECSSDADCADGQCLVGASGVRRCEPISCAVGRPFLVAEEAVRAPAVERSDWLGVTEPHIPVSAEIRAALTEHWTRTALAEHASVAAFARFAMQLLSIGAPAELVEQATRAQADELRHARMAFALASAYGGLPVGPGMLEVARALDDLSPEGLLRTTFREGCVGETAAALEVLEAAEHASDPVLARGLRQIGADESRHAELAWRFVGWMVQTQGSWVAGVLREELAAVVVPDSDGSGVLEYGVLDGERKRVVRERALADVIAPCTERLLALARMAA